MLDGRDVWHKPCLAVARARGYEAERITQGQQAANGWGFIRPHADPNMLDLHKVDYQLMQANGCRMIQDGSQVELYENKSGQFWRWSKFMPRTWRYASLTEALAGIENLPLPIVSKADEGASSANIRIFHDLDKLRSHVKQIFTKGIPVDHCSGGYVSKQRDYVLLQELIPHTFTWRVNRIGNSYAVFKRYNYKDKPVAQTGNTKPVVRGEQGLAPVLGFAAEVTAAIGSKWVALDILQHSDGSYKLLETSLAWPTDGFHEAVFWHCLGSVLGDNVTVWYPSGRTWGDIWEVLFDEMEAGAWD